jgi:hypothetical protein
VTWDIDHRTGGRPANFVVANMPELVSFERSRSSISDFYQKIIAKGLSGRPAARLSANPLRTSDQPAYRYC